MFVKRLTEGVHKIRRKKNPGSDSISRFIRENIAAILSVIIQMVSVKCGAIFFLMKSWVGALTLL